MRSVDIYRMNKQLLYEYLRFLLSDEKIAVLERRAGPEAIRSIITGLTGFLSPLPYYYTLGVLERMQLLAANLPEEQDRIATLRRQARRKRQWERALPWIVAGISLLLCFIMFLLYRR